MTLRPLLPSAGCPYTVSTHADVHIAVDGPHTCKMPSIRLDLNLVTLKIGMKNTIQ